MQQLSRRSRVALAGCGLLALVGFVGLLVGGLAGTTHGLVVAERIHRPLVWGSLVAGAVLAAAFVLARRPRLAAAMLVVAVLGGFMLTSVTSLVEPRRGREFPSPDGRWSVRLDDRGFQEPLYAVVVSERAGLGSRYWQAGRPSGPELGKKAQVPLWTSDDTVVIAIGDQHSTWRMTADGPVRVG